MKNLLMVVSPKDFRDEEAFIPLEIFKNRINVKIASKNTKKAIGKFGGILDIDLDILKVNINDFDAICFVGGPGAYDYFDDENIKKIIKLANNKNKLIAAICISPMILAKAGILENKKATVWDLDKKQSDYFNKNNIEFVDKEVVVFENIITANGPSSAKNFAEKILSFLF